MKARTRLNDMRRVVVVALSVVVVLSCEIPHVDRQPQREAVLRDDLFLLRRAIDLFYAGEKRYPTALDELVPNYLRRIPIDPMTGAPTWVVVRDGAAVVDVRSSARGTTDDGVPYNQL